MFTTRCRIHGMPCKTCSHHDRNEIDRLIVSGTALRPISARFGLSLGALHRHKTCVKQALADAMRCEQGQRAEQGGQLLERVLKLMETTEKILATATSKEDLRAATGAVGALTRLIELLGRLSGELQSAHSGGIHLNLTSNKVTIKHGFDDDTEFAQLISEATNGFDPAELLRLQQLVVRPVENASFTELSVKHAFNDPPKALNLKP